MWFGQMQLNDTIGLQVPSLAVSTLLQALLTCSKTAFRLVRFIMRRSLLVLNLIDTLNSRLTSTCSSSVLLSLEIADEKTTILIIAMRSVDRTSNTNNIKDTGRLVEDLVHFFERSVGCFGVAVNGCQYPAEVVGDLMEYEQEVYAWYDKGVDHREDDVCLVTDSVKCNRSDHDNHEVEDPVSC